MKLSDVTACGPHCIFTYTGKVLDLANPNPNDIRIEDIARGLSTQFRFGGQSCSLIPVAEHSVTPSYLADKDNSVPALIHDAPEAYIRDITSPIKVLMPDYQAIEDRLMRAIATRFGFQYPFHPKIKEIDADLLHMEWKDLVIKPGPVWSIQVAETKFLNRFKKLTDQE